MKQKIIVCSFTHAEKEINPLLTEGWMITAMVVETIGAGDINTSGGRICFVLNKAN